MTETPFTDISPDDRVQLFSSDCLEVLRTLADASVDAVITDPPYGIEFMGNDWDAPWKQASNDGRMSRGAVIGDPAVERGGFQDGNGGNPYSRSRIEYGRGGAASVGFQLWCEQWARECLRVLKPGGHLAAFGGTRTYHRLACAVEDAGFEIRDSIGYGTGLCAWTYGSGFPKSMDVSKAIDKAAGVERQDVYDTRSKVTDNEVYGTGLGVGVVERPVTNDAKKWQGWGTGLKPAWEPIVLARKPFKGTVAANVVGHGTGALNIDASRVGTDVRVNEPGSTNPRIAMGGGWREDAEPRTVTGRWPANVALDESAAAELDAQTGVSRSTQRTGTRTGRRSGERDVLFGGLNEQQDVVMGHDDEGGASRFFYQAKASAKERPVVNGVAHPCVKPLSLLRWLIRLTVPTPSEAVVLDPFAGSGTTVEACLMEGVRSIGVEREESYIPLILSRIERQRR